MALDLKATGGAPLPVFANALGLRDAQDVHYARIVLFKSSERRRYESELLEARRQSQALEAATQNLLSAERENAVLREQFIAVLGHDLRNPLTGISGGVRLLRKGSRDGKRAARPRHARRERRAHVCADRQHPRFCPEAGSAAV